MHYKFNNSEEAIEFGRQATEQERDNLKKAVLIFQTQYDNLADFDRRMRLATWMQLCREALEEA